jgi:hypothetical protein
MQPAWTRFNREQAHDVLGKLAGNRDAVIFSKEATEVTWRTLPFYTHYRLYKLTNYATMPTFSLTYISNGEDFIALDGTANPIYTANEKDPIRLNEMTAVPYLDFFFNNVQGSEGDVFLIKDPKRMPMLDSLSANQQQSVVSSFKPLKVTYDQTEGFYRVSGTLYYGGSLISAVIQVMPDGKLAFEDQSLLLTGIHFPYMPHNSHWLEG